MGDSITHGYGPYFVKKFERRNLGKGHWIGDIGYNPCVRPWAQQIRDLPKERIDFVVFEDHYIQNPYSDFDPQCPSEDAWRAAWQQVIDAARAKGAFVIFLDGTHPEICGPTYTLSGIDICDYPVPPPDQSDGVHYTTAGCKVYAKNVVDLLDSLIP
jgi:hypothetical protein